MTGKKKKSEDGKEATKKPKPEKSRTRTRVTDTKWDEVVWARDVKTA